MNTQKLKAALDQGNVPLNKQTAIFEMLQKLENEKQDELAEIIIDNPAMGLVLSDNYDKKMNAVNTKDTGALQNILDDEEKFLESME